MDSLYWNSLNPKVKLKQTNKLYWNKYAYRAKLLVPCGNFLSSWLSSRYRDIDAVEYIRRRIENQNQNSGFVLSSALQHNIQRRKEREQINLADATTLEILKKAKEVTDVQFRVEEPYISLYHNSEQVLQDIVGKLPKRYIGRTLLEVSGITDSEHKEQLKPNVILNTKIGYKYKVMFNLTTSVRRNGTEILQYIDTLGDDHIYLPNGFRFELMTIRHQWIHCSYFYCNDLGILDFINLISPGACELRNVYELVPKKHK